MARLGTIPTLVLAGPTAVGKSEVAHAIARRIGAGIISTDSMMVYRGMDIGTAKPTPAERAGIDYTGLDFAHPDAAFSVYDYLVAVDRDLGKHPGKTWIAVGGTGLYVRGILQGIEDDPGENEALRAEADQIMSVHGFDALKVWCRSRLPEIDGLLPDGDRENPRRWIRAVERGGCRMDGRGETPPDVVIVGLRREREDLELRIRSRVEIMYRDGLLDEVANLRRQFPAWSRTAAMAIGYAEAVDVLEGRMKLNDATERTVIRTRQYAKRQMTWFRNQLPTHWVDVGAGDDVAKVADRVVSCWKEHGKID